MVRRSERLPLIRRMFFICSSGIRCRRAPGVFFNAFGTIRSLWPLAIALTRALLPKTSSRRFRCFEHRCRSGNKLGLRGRRILLTFPRLADRRGVRALPGHKATTYARKSAVRNSETSRAACTRSEPRVRPPVPHELTEQQATQLDTQTAPAGCTTASADIPCAATPWPRHLPSLSPAHGRLLRIAGRSVAKASG